MNNHELRLGNYLKLDGQTINIGSLQNNFYGVLVNGHSPDEFEPILLTEEILLKCGFKYSEPFPNIRGILTLDIFEVGYDKDDFFKNQFSLRIAKSVIVKVKYLHELQNIYYYMTNGKELEVKL